jgi:hypothetical protein
LPTKESLRLDAQGKPVLENSQNEKGRIEDVSEVDREYSEKSRIEDVSEVDRKYNERMKDEYAKWEDGA